MKANTDGSVGLFTDWHNHSRIDHNLTDEEILEQFGNHPDTPDTNAATFISWMDVNRKEKRLDGSLRTSMQKFYKDLDQYNSGHWNFMTQNSRFVTYSQKRDLITTLSSRLELNPSQQSRVRKQYLHMDLSKHGVVMELVAFALCAYQVHSDDRSIRKCHPQTPPESTDPLFADMLEYFVNVGKFTRKDFGKHYGKVQSLLLNWPEKLPEKRVRPEYEPEKFDRFGVDELIMMPEHEVEREDASVQAEMTGIDLKLEQAESQIKMGEDEGEVYKGLHNTSIEEAMKESSR